jgi:putative flippase GtrA
MVSGQAPETLARPAETRPRALDISRLRHADRTSWLQLLKFCTVGASGYVVNLVVFTLLLHGLGTGYIAAAIGAFLVSWLSNFVLNHQWTFPKAGTSKTIKAIKYMMVSVLGLLVNLGILTALVHAAVPTILAQAIAILAVTPITFLLTRSWAFR